MEPLKPASHQPPLFGYAVTGLLGVVVLVLAVRLSNREISFCRAIFAGLAQGKPSVQRHIAWERFNALGMDVGAAYAPLTKEEQAAYRQAFIAKFSDAFQRGGGRVQAFTKWRILERTPTEVVVETEHPRQNQTLLFRISRERPRRLEAVQWAEGDGRTAI